MIIDTAESLQDLLVSLRQSDIRLWVEGENLRFSAPPGALTPELRARLRLRKAEIVDFLRTHASAPITSPTTIKARERGSDIPLSFAQQRLWFIDQLEPGNPVYNHAAAVRFSGTLDVKRLDQSLQAVVARHEALRTHFVTVQDQPVQAIRPSLSLPLPVVDLCAFSPLEREARVQKIIDGESLAPFDLSSGPLVRTTLLRLSEQEHLFLLVVHHIVGDGWSTKVFWRELVEFYTAFTSGRVAQVPSLPIQYADYALWQRSWLQGEALDQQLNYWTQRLEGVPALLALPTDHPRPARQSYQGAHWRQELPSELTAEIKAVGREEHTTLFMTMMSAFSVLLARLSRQDDLVIGTPIANRSHPELEALIGFFANTLPIRVQLQETSTFHDVLQQVRSRALDAYAHQDVPFERLVEELQPERTLSHAPIVQTLLVVQEDDGITTSMPGVSMELLDIEIAVAKFDVTLIVREQGEKLWCNWEYNTELFEAETIARMGQYFQTLLEGLLKRPEQAIWRVPMLGVSEEKRILEEWDATQQSYPAACVLHEYFEEQARRTPDAIAVVFEELSLSYQALNEHANQIAHALQKMGVGPDVLVGLCVERSHAMVVGLLAILKAGGAFVSLDPSHPSERLTYLLQDSQAAVLLTQQSLVEHLPVQAVQLLCLDHPDLTHELKTTPQGTICGENLAYTIYTSGSTGHPKGAMISHRALITHTLSMAQQYHLEAHDRVLQFTALTFDISLEQIFPTLLSGACLILRGSEMWSPALLWENAHAFGLTVMNLAPAYWHQVAYEWSRYPEKSKDLRLRLVIVGGDKLLPHYVRLWQQLPLQQAQLLNAYGPAETTITSTTFAVPILINVKGTIESIPVGRPTSARRLYILDQYGQLVPPGQVGELYIGGDVLARGYLYRPDLTAERFLPDPFSPDPGSRMYRTGDLVRALPDNTIEFLDRIDSQVKILGIRVEIGEIEEALRQLPGVREAVVVARERRPGEKVLVAYLVATGARPSGSNVKRMLKSKLPSYMVPSTVVFLDALPLSPNGKIDRKRLPDVNEENEEDSDGQEETLTAMEEVVREVWCDVLNQKQIRRDSSFFDLGGHSLLVIQVISQLKNITGLQLHVRDIFEHSTVFQLAAYLEQKLRGGEQRVLSAIEPADRIGDLPLSFAQQRLWFIEQLEPGTALYVIPLAFRLQGTLQIAALSRSFHLVMQRHESLRTIFPSKQGVPRQIVLPVDENWQLPLIDLTTLPASERQAEAKRKMQQICAQPFDLERGPLFHMALLRVEPDEYMVVGGLHHIISDGWSIEVLQREVMLCYNALLAETPPHLPELPIQYADYALWQRSWLQGEALKQQLGYWTQRLEGVPALLELPTDHPRPARQSYQGAHWRQELSAELTAGIKAVGREEHTTLFMTMLAAFSVLLARLSRQDDLVIGTPIANRSRSEVAGLIGFFVNTLPIRVQLQAASTFHELLRLVRSRALEAYAHQDVPFERLVEQLQPERTLSHAPIIQVLLVVQEKGITTTSIPGISMEPVDIEMAVAKFDVTLTVREQGERLWCNWEYDTALFDVETMVRMGQHFQTLLEGLLKQPEQAIWQVPMLRASEKKRILEEWNATQQRYPAALCLHEHFEEQVRKTPDAIAVVFEELCLSYRTLNERANQVAYELRARGVGPEVAVGICIERSVEMVIGLLAILKAGGAYVPLDPDYPVERLRFLVEDIGGDLVLIQEKLRSKLSLLPVSLLSLDGEQACWSDHPQANPLSPVGLDNLAYIIYTSGSTGKPKGAMNTHRAINNRLLWMQETYHLTAQDRVLQKTPFSFDVSVWEFFWPLLAGARLVMARPGLHRDNESLIANICEQQITVLHFVPSMLNLFLQEKNVEQCQSIRQVICSGEALLVEQQKRFFEKLDARLDNLYGPTEAAIDVSYWRCERGDGRTTVPIGRPIANIQLYVLDQYGQPVPEGIAGELHIGGVGLARGYLKRADLTAERFVPDPFSQVEGARLYKTGDLACYQRDGTIIYLGRIDHQVKLRGQRIELGEIEAILKQYNAIRECVVIVREDRQGEQRLVAYVVLAEGETMQVTALHQFLQLHLPQYMIPSAFVQLESLPLSRNGKLDRAALPVPQASRDEQASDYVGPRTQVEEMLAGIWSQVLGIDRISIHDNFFVLGGDSIRSIQVLALMRENGLQCTLQHLFLHQSIAELARELQVSQEPQQFELPTGAFCLISEEDQAKLPPGIEDAYPLTAMQMGMFYHLLMTPDNPLYHNVCSLSLQGTFDEQALRRALRMLVARHATLRTAFDLHSYSEPLQLVHREAEMSLIVEDLRDIPVEEQERIIDRFVQEEKRRPFDLARPPLLRFHIFRRSQDTFQLTLTEFHPILDGWSYHRNLVEVFANHDLFCKGEIPDQRRLQTTFRDYVALEQQILQSDEHRQYWMSKLQDFVFLQLPRLHADEPEESTAMMQSWSVPISSALAKQLEQLARANSLPLKSVLLAAHSKLLSVLGGTTDVLTNLVGNGRLEVADGEDVRGLFLLAVPFRLNIAPGSWLNLIRSTFELERESQPYRRYPLPAIQEDMGRQHLFETAFNYMHFHSAAELFSQRLNIIGPVRALEETNYTFQSDFMLSYTSAQLLLRLGYDANRISEAQIEAIGHYYQRILQAMVDDPHGQHQHVCVLSDQEVQQYVYDWNVTETLYAEEQGIHELFEAQVRSTPDAVALVFEDEQVTYQELNRRANQVAHFLLKQGIKPDTLVGIGMKRSPLMLVGLLGILKAGGAYLPLDLAHPLARLEAVIRDAGVALILTDQEGMTHLPEAGQSNICLDREWSLFAHEPEQNPVTAVTGENAIYTMYTSGSTGLPKGVVLTHRNVANFFVGMDQRLAHLHPVGTWLAVTSISFDISVLELFWTLCRGFRVVIQSALQDTSLVEDMGDNGVPAQLVRHQVTHMQCTPSFIKMLLLMPDGAASLKNLAVLMVGGEALPPILAAQIQSYTTAHLLNMYGPTETTIWSTTSVVERQATSISLGQPIANTQVYVLDSFLEPVPPGVAGELYIAGAGLARGYLNRPEVTADRFIPNPWSSQPGKRLYRTGDLVRYLPNRDIEYLGRLDHQVKVNGHRIELGEIESALRLCQGVQECVVLAVGLADGEKRLVAYVVPTSNRELTIADLRLELQTKLPHWMLPSAFVPLDRLPMTVNGKLDRNALPTPEWEGESETAASTAPRTELEKLLCNIWSQVLGKGHIGIHDNFFALGGDSILLVQVVTRAVQAGIPLEIKHILNYQTIADVSALLGALAGEGECDRI